MNNVGFYYSIQIPHRRSIRHKAEQAVAEGCGHFAYSRTVLTVPSFLLCWTYGQPLSPLPRDRCFCVQLTLICSRVAASLTVS